MVSERRNRALLAAAGLAALAGLVSAQRGPVPTAEAAPTGPPAAAVLASGHQPDAAPGGVATTAKPTVTPKTPLKGMTGAATALATKDYARALDLVRSVEAPLPGSEMWFWVGALEGRALLRLGKAKEAVAVLAPRWDHRRSSRNFPRDALGLELAQARVAFAASGDLSVRNADAERRRALKILARTRKHEPLRTFAEIRVVAAETSLAIEGTSKHAKKVAALRGLRAIDKILKEYPKHPRIGQMWLSRARAMERAGRSKDALNEYRQIAIIRTGEPEAEEAWAEYQRLGAANKRLRTRGWSTRDQLTRAQAARRMKRVKLSRQLLDEIIEDEKMPKHMRAEARHSRSWTAYKQRDFSQCVEDLRPAYKASGNLDVKERLLKCLERGHFYDEAIEMWLKTAKEHKRRGMKAAAVWTAVQLALRGGKYQRASELLDNYEKRSKGHRQSRAWLRAWLAYRLGKTDEAIAGFENVERYRTDRRKAQYYRGQLLLKASEPEQKKLGGELLTRLISHDPLDYYSLWARKRLTDAGLKAPTPPKLSPMAEEARPPTRAATQVFLDEFNAEFGKAWPPIRRARQLYGAGYLEEARRELRVASKAYLTRGKGGGYRSEAILKGLGWRAMWTIPRVAPTKSGRRTLRSKEDAEKLRQGFRKLARAFEEPHRFAKLTRTYEAPSKARWYPRAFRPQIEREARLRKVDPFHLWSLMYTESRFRRFVVSPVGARGALQIMPWTARQLAERLGELEDGRFNTDLLFDIDTNAHLASYYISELIEKFHGQAPMAYASYNGGPSNVSRWLRAKSKSPAPLELDAFIEEIPFRETHRYTKRVVEVYSTYHLLYDGKLPELTAKVDPVFEDNIDF